jgi:hypothetical protein
VIQVVGIYSQAEKWLLRTLAVVREKVSRERRTRAGVNCERRYDTY